MFGGIWALILWVLKAVECFKHCSKDHTSRNMEGRGIKSYLNCLGLDQEVSEEKKFSMLPRNGSCDILGEGSSCLLLFSGESA